MAQGIPWTKEKVIEALKPFFLHGCSVTQACKYAGIAQSTVQTWIDKDEELRLQIDAWRNEMNMEARKVFRKKITKKEDLRAAETWLKAHEKDEFSEKQQIEQITPTKVELEIIMPEEKKKSEEIKKEEKPVDEEHKDTVQSDDTASKSPESTVG